MSTASEEIHVNRTEEINTFTDTLLTAGPPYILFIQGPSGIGKTHVKVQCISACRFRQLRCSSIDLSAGFTIESALEEILDQLEIDTSPRKQSPFRGTPQEEFFQLLDRYHENKGMLVLFFDQIDKLESEEVQYWFCYTFRRYVLRRKDWLRVVYVGQLLPPVHPGEPEIKLLNLDKLDRSSIEDYGAKAGIPRDPVITTMLEESSDGGVPRKLVTYVQTVIKKTHLR